MWLNIPIFKALDAFLPALGGGVPYFRLFPGYLRGVNSGGTGCQEAAADHVGIAVLGFHSLLRGRMGIFGGDRHRPHSLQFLNASL